MWIEVLAREGFGDAGIAARLGRDRAAVWRERKRCGSGGRSPTLTRGCEGPGRRGWPPTGSCAVRCRCASTSGCLPTPSRAELAQCGFRVCPETICRGCYDRAGRSGLRAGTCKKLPRARRRRKPRCRREEAKRSALGRCKPIADRPRSAEDREEPGHWEGDLVIGKNNQSAVATLVERSSRHTLLVPLPGGYDAPSTARAVAAALARQPAHMVRTLIWDQCTETARWADIEAALDSDVYFCEPRSPWQRPTNEQNNGILRRWLPKGTDLNIAKARPSVIEDRINNTPRKLHHWHSAQTIYNELCRDHQ